MRQPEPIPKWVMWGTIICAIALVLLLWFGVAWPAEFKGTFEPRAAAVLVPVGWGFPAGAAILERVIVFDIPGRIIMAYVGTIGREGYAELYYYQGQNVHLIGVAWSTQGNIVMGYYDQSFLTEGKISGRLTLRDKSI